METVDEYAYQVYKERSFTKAAKSLYISQPSLSAAISRLEKRVGVRIFDRSTIPVSLTAEGRVYIESIEEIMESENNMLKRIRALSDVVHGSIIIGGQSFASYLLMSEICGEFYKNHPKTQVTLDIGNIGNSQNLWEKLGNKELDILVTYIGQSTKYIIEPIFEERLIIAMHKKMPGAKEFEHLALTREEILTKSYPPEREIEDLSIFRDVKFLDFPNKTDTQRRMVRMLGDYKSSNYKIVNARHSEMHYNLMCEGLGAVVTNTLTIAQKNRENDDILFFMPKHSESYRTVFLAYSHDSSDNLLVKSFIKTAKDVCAEK